MQAQVRLPLREQAELLHGLVRQHPRVLADVAGFEPRRERVGALRNAREAARHDLIALVRGGHVHAQRNGRRLQRVRARPDRRRRQRGRFLAHEVVAVALDLVNQLRAFLGRHARRHEPAFARGEQVARRTNPADDEPVEVLQHVVAFLFLAAPPRCDARHREVFVQEEAREARQEAQESVALDEAAAERVADRHAAGACGLEQARHAEQRVGAQLERIAELGADAPHDEVDGLQSLDGLHEHAVVANGQVRAFDDAEAEIPREIRVLEVGLLRGARRQEYGLRLIAARQRQESLAERAEEAREPAHVALARTAPASTATRRRGSRARSPRPTAPACGR